jgi:starvation-inducible DNA-binding protein
MNALNLNLANALKILLATNFVLYLKTHSAHWNVKGMFFKPFHDMFGEQYSSLWKQNDTIAEKIRMLDCDVVLGPAELVNLSVIDPKQDLLDASGYCTGLLRDHERMIMLLNKVFAVAQAENNQAVMNYLADRLDAHAKIRWFLQATLNSTGR